VDQFLRDGVNQRTDSYGGSIAKRCKFPLELVARISESIGPEKVGIRFSPNGSFNSMSDSDPTALFTHLLQRLNDLHPKLAYVHFTTNTPHSTDDPLILTQTENIIHQVRKVWNGKCILNLPGMSREKTFQVVAEGKAEMVAFGREFLANPDLPLRLFKNLPLNLPDPNTFYTNQVEGYTDYPFYENKQPQSGTVQFWK